MYRKIAVAGATAAVIVGAGTAALATSGSDTTTGTGTTSGTSAAASPLHPRRAAIAALRRTVHGQITTAGKDGYVTHSGIRGTVDAVSATSITVKATDGFTQTFTLTKNTKVRERKAATGKGVAGVVSDVKSGDRVGVLGKAPETSTANPTATLVVVR